MLNCLPRLHPTLHIDGIEAALLQKIDRVYAAGAGGAVDHNLALAKSFQFLPTLAQFLHGNVQCAGNIAAAEFCQRADIEQNWQGSAAQFLRNFACLIVAQFFVKEKLANDDDRQQCKHGHADDNLD